jgi:hypothetical protein
MRRLMRGAACEELSGVEHVLDPVQELSGLSVAPRVYNER